MKDFKDGTLAIKVIWWLLPLALLNEIALLWLTLGLPERVAVHLNYHMVVDRMGSKWIIPVFGLMPVALAIGMLVYVRRTANNAAVAQNRRVEGIVLPLIGVFMLLATWLPALIASDPSAVMGAVLPLPLEFIILLPLGLLMIVIGNFLGVIKQNRWLGIRTPWTLADETVWKRTHRLGGWLGVAGGVCLCACTVLGHMLRASWLSFVGLGVSLVLMAAIPIWYSYHCFKKKNFCDK